MATKKFAEGQRVRVKAFPFKGHTGTIIGRGRLLGRKVWYVELDQAAGFGGRMFKGADRELQPLATEEDPRTFRT